MDKHQIKSVRVFRRESRTADEITRLKRIREKYQRERPTLDDLIEAGDIKTVMTQGEYFDSLGDPRRGPVQQ
ncbi:MAG TPA: hypothetical protein VGH32_03425 [Pirellulales bacterium]